MRSVLDHFRDPYLALKEAHRVLRCDGALLIGLAVRSAPASGRDANLRQDLPVGPLPVRVARKIRQEGLPGMVRVVAARVRTLIRGPRDHTFHWRYEDVIDLLDRCGFEVVKEHWQKPPYTMCVYLQARKGLPPV
jgi:SAM-dependent methyltransferase